MILEEFANNALEMGVFAKIVTEIKRALKGFENEVVTTGDLER